MNITYRCAFWKRERRHQKVYILCIYSIRQYFDKIRAVSLGYPMGMFGVSFGAISCLDRERVYESSCCYGYMIRRKREKLQKMTLIVVWCDNEMALIGVWWDKIVLNWGLNLFDEIGDFRGFEVRGKWMFVGGGGGKIDILVISRTGVTIRKNLVTIRKKVAKRVAYVGFFLYLCSRFWKIRV